MIFDILFGFSFFALWLWASYVHAKDTRWGALSHIYLLKRESGALGNELIQMVPLVINGYWSNIYSLRAGEAGLVLKVLFPFRPWHPGLVIPWSQLIISPDSLDSKRRPNRLKLMVPVDAGKPDVIIEIRNKDVRRLGHLEKFVDHLSDHQTTAPNSRDRS